MPQPPDEFMTVAEVAAILKLNQQTMRNYIFSTVFAVCPATAGLHRRCADRPSTSAAVTQQPRTKETNNGGGGAVSGHGPRVLAPGGKPC